ncbi:MAG: class II aldolase/adducin family protein [Alphaproteobacteria bacterium]|nr:class II aldolase/adducin family protein [Alphaproteobacteria bacterium]
MDDTTLRRELLLAFHILDLNGQNSGIAGHLTARHPGAGSFWCHGYGQGFDEVRAEDLHHADLDLKLITGRDRISPSLSIHGAIYRARPDVACVVHTHDLDAVALTATGAELQPLYQSALMFAGAVATHVDYGGIVETAESGRALAVALGPRRALLLGNHGTLVVGASIREAVHATIMLAAACRVQLRAMAAAAGRPLQTVDATTASEATRFLLSPKVLALRWDYYVRQAVAARPWLAGDAIAPAR